MKIGTDSLPIYKVLLSPTIASANNAISILLPPFSYESQIYIDVIDSESNYVST